jgi:hypothetical protein
VPEGPNEATLKRKVLQGQEALYLQGRSAGAEQRAVRTMLRVVEFIDDFMRQRSTVQDGMRGHERRAILDVVEQLVSCQRELRGL